MANFLRPSKIELSKGLKELLNLEAAREYDGTLTRQPINESSIKFSFRDAAMVFLTYDQVDDAYVNNT